MECGSLLPLLRRERFPSSIPSAVLSAAGPAKAEGLAGEEALATEDAESKAAASRRTPKRQGFHHLTSDNSILYQITDFMIPALQPWLFLCILSLFAAI